MTQDKLFSIDSRSVMVDIVQRNRIVEENLGLVGRVVNLDRYARAVERIGGIDDAFQVGGLALMRAADSFDAHKGIKFSTYATWAIYHAIQRAADESGLVRVPRKANRGESIRVRGGDSLDVIVCPERTCSAIEDALYRGVESLPAAMRDCVDLYYFEGFSLTEIGVRRGTSHQSVSLTLKQAYKRLRVYLESEKALTA